MGMSKGAPQLSRFCPVGTHPKEGRGFEQIMLGPKIPQERIWTKFERNTLRKIRNDFERAIIFSTTNQPRGMPWGSSGYLVDELFTAVRENFATTEWQNLYLLSTLGTCLDHSHHTDFLMLYRGGVVTIDLSLRNKVALKTMRPHLVLSDLTYANTASLEGFAEKIADGLVKGEYALSWDAFIILKYRLKCVYKRA